MITFYFIIEKEVIIMFGTILFIVCIVLVVLFLIYQKKILSFIYNKVKNDNTVKELQDKDILTPHKVYSYKLGGVKDLQEVIEKLSLRTPLEIRKVMNEGKTSYALFYKGKAVGYIAYSFIKQNFNDIFKGVRYNFVISKIEVFRKKKYPYIKIWKEDTSGFDLSNILKRIDYRIGDFVEHASYGTGVVQEIRMNSVIVKFKQLMEIKDLKSLKLK